MFAARRSGSIDRMSRAFPRLSVRRMACLGLVAVLWACADASGERAAPTGPTPPPGGIDPGPYTAGRSYFGRNEYVEYVAGNAPVVLTAPHGGALVPAEIPDRTAARCGGSATTATDLGTVELVRAMQARYFARFGTYPHVVINHLARRKLDANRTGAEAACGAPAAEAALAEWHAFIDAAKAAAIAANGKAWVMDMHGHGHPTPRLELGYLLSNAQLDLTDAVLDGNAAVEDTASIRTLSEGSPVTFSAMLRGPHSLGSLYAGQGFPSVPSAADPRPGSAPYFSGGDNTRRHACGAEADGLGGRSAGDSCGVQVESHYEGVRDNAANRDRFGDATALVLEQFLYRFWGLTLGSAPPPPAR